MIRSREDNGSTLVQHTEHLYDSAGRLSRQAYTLGGDMYTETYSYSGTDGTMTTATTDATSANNVGATAFSTALHNGNWSYYYTQTKRESIKAGVKAIGRVVKSHVPTVVSEIVFAIREAS